MYYDAHTHLNDSYLYENWKEHIQEFLSIGGKWLINIGVDHVHNQRAIQIAHQASLNEEFRQLVVKATIGIHPYEIAVSNITDTNKEQEISNMKTLYETNKQHIVAIGEIGIDTHYEWTQKTLSLQKELFDRQCSYADKLWLPVVIHSRANFPATLEVLQHYPHLAIYFHCRSYDTGEIQQAINMFPNFYVGFCGNITYKKADNIRNSLHILRNESPQSILLETDAPYLSPQAVRKHKNKPSFIPYLYQFVAEQLAIKEDQLQQTIKSNFTRLYQL